MRQQCASEAQWWVREATTCGSTELDVHTPTCHITEQTTATHCGLHANRTEHDYCFPHTVDWSGWQEENVGLCGRRQLTRWGIKRIAERKLVQNEAVEKGRKPLDYDRARQRNNNEQLSALSHQMTAETTIPNQSNLTRPLHFSISIRRYEKLDKLVNFHRISLVWFVI